MFAGKLFASAALAAALIAPVAAHAADAKVITTAVTAPVSKSSKDFSPLPAKLYLVSVDTRDCFEGGINGSAAGDFAANCSTLASMMPELRRIPSIRTQVEKVLCPRVETIGEDGKKTSAKVCRTDIKNVAKLSDYQVVGLAYQLNILR